MTDRERILRSLGSAEPSRSEPWRPEMRSSRGADELWATFEQRLTDLGGRLVAVDDLKSLAGEPTYADADCRAALAALQLSVDPIVGVWEAEVGITRVDLAIAETGSLLLSAGPGRRRLGSLTCKVHLALVPADAIVANLAEGLARMSCRTSVFITGPSRTADIEGVLVRGVHGPRELWVLRI